MISAILGTMLLAAVKGVKALLFISNIVLPYINIFSLAVVSSNNVANTFILHYQIVYNLLIVLCLDSQEVVQILGLTKFKLLMTH